MTLIFCYWDNLIEPKLSSAFENAGHKVIPFRHTFKEKDYDTEYLSKLINFVTINTGIDFIISINYIPIISRACKFLNMPYLSWLCDCPSYSLYSKTFPDPHN